MIEIESELHEQSKKLELLNRIESSSFFKKRSNSVPNEKEEDLQKLDPEPEADSMPIYSDEFLLRNSDLTAETK